MDVRHGWTRRFERNEAWSDASTRAVGKDASSQPTFPTNRHGHKLSSGNYETEEGEASQIDHRSEEQDMDMEEEEGCEEESFGRRAGRK